ncbi:MAG: transcriptional coactivator hfi1/ADA1 [Vezdaea acicularis]|nr:MAG: transcriptional coactivator hfi1/ADA1 [Vezdaea acicularis]
MPDIDPAALSRNGPGPSTTIAPTSITKSIVTSSAPPTRKESKTHSMVARIDLEPLYTALKAGVGEQWGVYKESITLFMLGQFNQEELNTRLATIVTDAQTAHLHNQLVSAIYGNVTRELPEQGVATWVSANDKPTTVSKPVSGDAAEQRLKTEIMQLPARDRRRIKETGRELGDIGDPYDFYSGLLIDERRAKDIKLPDVVPASAGGLSKTNWELEIRKRYMQPLSSETGELPSAATIKERIVPICYEEGVVSGPSLTVPHFLSVATSTYIKEVLSSVFSRTRSNGPNYISTNKYKRQLEREEELWLREEIARSSGGLLPVEQKAAAERDPLAMADMRIAVEMGEPWLGSMPLTVHNIITSYLGDDDTLEGEANDERANGTERKNSDIRMENSDASDSAYGWEGGAQADRDMLDSLLDDCLAVGQ